MFLFWTLAAPKPSYEFLLSHFLKVRLYQNVLLSPYHTRAGDFGGGLSTFHVSFRESMGTTFPELSFAPKIA